MLPVLRYRAVSQLLLLLRARAVCLMSPKLSPNTGIGGVHGHSGFRTVHLVILLVSSQVTVKGGV